MMKRFFLFFVFGFVHCPAAVACDSCGCGANSGMGLLTAYRNNYVGMAWQWSAFQTESGYESHTEDNYHIFELSASYHFNKRFKGQVFLPFRLNLRESYGAATRLGGVSDARLLGSYIAFDNAPVGKRALLYMELAAGVKLPTGKYTPRIHDQNLPENFNVGNGAFGFIMQPNVVWNFGQSGLVMGAGYLHHSRSRSGGYRFGHQFQSQLLAFWEKVVSVNLKLIPNAGFKAEWVGGDTYANGNQVHGTGGAGGFASAALNLKGERYFAGFSYAYPFIGQYAGGEASSKGRMACQLSYIF